MPGHRQIQTQLTMSMTYCLTDFRHHNACGKSDKYYLQSYMSILIHMYINI